MNESAGLLIERPAHAAHGEAQRHEQQRPGALTHIVAHALRGQVMVVENDSEMLPLWAGAAAQIETVRQALREGQHLRGLTRLAQCRGDPVWPAAVEPQWLNIRNHFSTAVRRGDLTACLIIQDLMALPLAIVLLRTLARSADADTALVARPMLADKLARRASGLRRIGERREADPDATHRALVWAHHRVMPELFRVFCRPEVSTRPAPSAHGAVARQPSPAEMETLRRAALQAYTETLDAAGFDLKVTMPLLACLSGEGMQARTATGLRTTAAARFMAHAGLCC